MAIKAYRLAIECQTIARAKHSLLGRLYLRLGCLYRQNGMANEDKECRVKSLEHLHEAYTGEHYRDSAAEMNLIFLIGSLYEHLEQYNDAVQWFSRVVNHPNKSSNPHVVNMARERWQEIRHKTKSK